MTFDQVGITFYCCGALFVFIMILKELFSDKQNTIDIGHIGIAFIGALLAWYLAIWYIPIRKGNSSL